MSNEAERIIQNRKNIALSNERGREWIKEKLINIGILEDTIAREKAAIQKLEQVIASNNNKFFELGEQLKTLNNTIHENH